jgi:flavin-dependent dehydrogenase
MQRSDNYEVIIIGGGLAGLVAAIELGKHKKVLLLEKGTYPQHRVCGEYVSNEVLPYLQSIGVDPMEHGAKNINTFQISTHDGKLITSHLPLGGFGISRYAFDAILFEKAKQVSTVSLETCTEILFKENLFTVSTKEGNHYEANYVVGAYGKRSNLDKSLDRKFINENSPWLAVKAHYTYPFEDNTVALHNFEGGYCGLSKIETGAVNACYLTTYVKNITEFQQKVLSVNPFLAEFFKKAIPLFDEPLTISQISFEAKDPVENNIFMIGDAAGLIHPLCGNGMAMAIHSAKLLSDIFVRHEFYDRSTLENEFIKSWSQTFSRRLQMGRRIQSVLLRPTLAKVSFNIARMFPSVVPRVIKKTHGDVII